GVGPGAGGRGGQASVGVARGALGQLAVGADSTVQLVQRAVLDGTGLGDLVVALGGAGDGEVVLVGSRGNRGHLTVLGCRDLGVLRQLRELGQGDQVTAGQRRDDEQRQ